MDAVGNLVSVAASRGLKFLLVGGHAVAMHGYGRTTKDVDILVCKDDRDQWLEIMTASGWALHHDGGTFLQFRPSAGDGWPVDLMLVNAATFGKMLADSITAQLDAATVPVVSLNHLLALKLFALKQKQSHRAVKDMDDLLNLILKNGVDARSAAFRELVEKYGDAKLYKKICQAIRA
ncbi:MAG: nucleotidyl transferase AbiEii/AbiGii toxin family protein [Verrucomicrobiae bacterium]|nr:nucleotidyl transferase AbiEii/AbiGii toxin family protein [Verrucomicrobiae bacterium]